MYKTFHTAWSGVYIFQVDFSVPSTRTVSENDGFVEVIVTSSGPINGRSFIVDYLTVPGSASKYKSAHSGFTKISTPLIFSS